MLTVVLMNVIILSVEAPSACVCCSLIMGYSVGPLCHVQPTIVLTGKDRAYPQYKAP
jgi:hypothetical protein